MGVVAQRVPLITRVMASAHLVLPAAPMDCISTHASANHVPLDHFARSLQHASAKSVATKLLRQSCALSHRTRRVQLAAYAQMDLLNRLSAPSSRIDGAPNVRTARKISMLKPHALPSLTLCACLAPQIIIAPEIKESTWRKPLAPTYF